MLAHAFCPGRIAVPVTGGAGRAWRLGRPKIGPLALRAAPITERLAAQTSERDSRDITKLVDTLQGLEAQLQSMFEPGKRMPKASEVSSMRQEIESIKSLLMTFLNGGADVDEGGADTQALQQARVLLDGTENATTPDFPRWDSARNDPDYGLQLAMLEVENQRLREEARLLLERQALLEELAAQKGVRVHWRQR